jgi:hypothetical protein
MRCIYIYMGACVQRAVWPKVTLVGGAVCCRGSEVSGELMKVR